MFRGQTVTLIIPARNEGEAIGPLVGEIPRPLVDHVVVVDNGSSDATAARAREAGAVVLREERKGYGSACLKAIREGPVADIYVFMDGDGSDLPHETETLLRALIDRDVELLIGSRVLGRAEPGALTPVQVFGNALTCTLLRWLWGVCYTDLGPFRAIRRSALERLDMSDPDFGWTIEMQVKAAQQGLRVAEIPVSRRVRRAGKSKVSGSIVGSFRAGSCILGYVLRAKAAELLRRDGWPRGGRRAVGPHGGTVERLIVFTRYPEVGRVKTRLIPTLGPEGACVLHRRMAERTLEQARRLAGLRGGIALEVRYDGADGERMRRWLGEELCCRSQGSGDLGARMSRAFEEGFAEGAEAVVLIGSDCPELSARTMSRAFDALRNAALVLGPAADGGYYLIGLGRSVPELFEGIEWGTGQVLGCTQQRAAAMGLEVVMLETLNDVDRPEDLGRVRSLLRDRSRA